MMHDPSLSQQVTELEFSLRFVVPSLLGNKERKDQVYTGAHILSFT